ncbi:ferredoxin [Williamsia maris]|uniref:Ferredoxin n=1 Tax=Williamsia maris TaxID=72806 RepID=A0ABT1HHN3_9NOCA|nr:ferredoxin [Williamsia maris]MCP2177709.1 Ferredoxin [Williamsia maris]
MRIEIDLDLCQGHGVCEMEASEVFEAFRDHVELRQARPDDSERDDVERAVQYCPTQALRIIED